MATSLALTDLTQGTTYEFCVIAKGNGSDYADSDASSIVEWKTQTQLATPTVTLTKTTSSFTASWGTITNATSYVVEYKLSTASTWTTTTSASTSKTISSLTSGKTYNVRVKATSTNAAYADSDYSTTQSVTISTQLAAPAPTYDSTVDSISASWPEVANAASYKVFYKKKSATTYSSDSVTTTTWSKSSLTSGDVYTVYVQAIGSGNYTSSANSTATDVTVKTQLPNPNAPTLTNRTTSSLTFTWNAIAHADGYKVYATVAGKHKYYDTATNSITISELEEGTDVTVFVAALGSGAYVSSEGGDSGFGTTQITLATPTGLTASNVLSTTATLSWNAVTNATGYNITLQDANGVVVGYEDVNQSGASINLTDLEENREYTAYVYAYSSSDDYVASQNATLVFTTDTKLGTPSAPVIAEKTISSLKVTWGAVSAADSYTLSYKLSSASNWTDASIAASASPARTYTLSNLGQGETYQFKVKAVTTNDAYENGEYSSVTSGTTLIKLAAPDGLAVTDIRLEDATLNWNAVEHANNGYIVKYRKKGTTTWTSVSVEG